MKTLNRWHFLAEPFDALLEQHEVKVIESAWPDQAYRIIVHPDCVVRVVTVTRGLPPLEREMAARGLIAASFGADTADWPVPLEQFGERAA